MTKMANQQTNFPFSKIIPQLDKQDNWEKKYQTDLKKKKILWKNYQVCYKVWV